MFVFYSSVSLELYCPVLETPYHGHVTPATCSKKYENIRAGTVCRFACSRGYELKTNVGAESLSCRIDGTWDHGSPNCHRMYLLIPVIVLSIRSIRSILILFINNFKY